MSNKCERCADVVSGRKTMCHDCIRKTKAINRRRTCAFPNCTQTYHGVGSQKYCLEHKALSSRERQDLAELVRSSSV